jgi:hypothetical protein
MPPTGGGNDALPCGHGAAIPRQRTRSGGRVTTRQAAAALRLQPRQIRNLIAVGELEAETEGEGVNRRYLVSIASVDSLRIKRHQEGKLPGQDRVVTEGAATPGQSGQDAAALARELAAELGEIRYELGRAEARLELTTQAESSIREALDRERERADLERERADRLESELLAMYREPPEPRDAPEAASETSTVAKVRKEDTDEPRRSSWWRRFFGFDNRGSG